MKAKTARESRSVEIMTDEGWGVGRLLHVVPTPQPHSNKFVV